MKRIPIAALAAGLLAAPALAQTGETMVTTTRYNCDRGVMVPATYVTAADQALAVIHVEGAQITLYAEEAASGLRYGWPSDGSNYVWWTKGAEATLFWKDSEAGTEEPVLTGCVEGG